MFPPGEANQAADYERLHASQARVGYPSDVYQGKDARDFLRRIWPDFKTDGIDVVLHEKVSGYAGTRQAIAGLAQKCLDHGVRIFPASKSRVTTGGGLRVEGPARRTATSAATLSCSGSARGRRSTGRCSASPTHRRRYPDGATVRKDM
jgi:hypothetical protein